MRVILKDGGFYELSQKQLDYWQSIFINIDVVQEINSLEYLWKQNLIKRKTAKSIDKFIVKHLSSVSHNLE